MKCDYKKMLSLESSRGNSIPSLRGVYRSVVRTKATKERRAASAELFTLDEDTQSVWYRLLTDEVISYHGGAPLLVITVSPDGTEFSENVAGGDITAGEMPLVVIPLGSWRLLKVLKGAEGETDGIYSSTVVPGFDKLDYMESDVIKMIELCPELKDTFDYYSLL